MKTSVGKGMAVTKADFRSRLRKARHNHYVSESEVDLLFGVFDKVKDGLLTLEDLSPDKVARLEKATDKRWDGPV